MLDAIDRMILSRLQIDGRIKNQDLAAEIGLSPSSCLDRVKKLENDGVITGYQATVDPEAVGCPILVIVSVLLERTSETVYEELEHAMSALTEVQECFMVTGNVDYIVKVRASSIAHFREILTTKIQSLPFVKITHSDVVMQEVKSHGMVPVVDATAAG